MAFRSSKSGIIKKSNIARDNMIGIPTSGMEFSKYQLFITDDYPTIPYYEVDKSKLRSFGYGQLKLMIEEISFLNIFWNPQEIDNPQYVVAGAASGQHYPILSTLFPKITFHLYDTADFSFAPKEKYGDKEPGFSVKEYPRLKIYYQYFDRDSVRYWRRKQKENGNVFLASDIRTVPDDPKLKNYEERVYQDMLLQEQWVLKINPVAASLKFRLPFIIVQKTGKEADEGTGEKRISIRTGKETDGLFRYLDGFVMPQAWIEAASSETRLIPIRNRDGKYFRRQWDAVKYQDQLMFHNTLVREKVEFRNPFRLGDQAREPIREPDLLNDYDSVLTVFTLRQYLEKMAMAGDNSENTLQLLDTIISEIGKLLPSGKQKTIATRKRIKQSITLKSARRPERLSSRLPARRDKGKGKAVRVSPRKRDLF